MALTGHADAAAAVHKLIGAMMVLFDGKRRSKVGLTLALPRPGYFLMRLSKCMLETCILLAGLGANEHL